MKGLDDSRRRSQDRLPAQRAGQEVQRNFADIRRLFDFAEQQINRDMSYEDYVRPAGKIEHPRLPEELRSALGQFPGDYFVVHYDNRNNHHYQKGTRGRTVLLSTSEARNLSDQRIREIEFKEPDPEELDSKMYMTVREAVNERSFEDINMAGHDETDSPHGEARLRFTLHPSGERQLSGSTFNRMDEGIFEWKGEQKPVRWLRNLEVAHDAQRPHYEYREVYIIGHYDREAGLNQVPLERTGVTTTIEGSLENPNSILVEIGIPGSPSRTLYQDEKIRVTVDRSIGEYKNQLEIIRQDPNYSMLLEPQVDVGRLLTVIRSKIRLLEQDWDKQHAVFGAALESSESNALPKPE